MSAGLYIHLPFCVTKCPYCDFFSVTERASRHRLVEAVLHESDLRAGGLGPFDTLYLGGGTPSCLELELLRGLIEGLSKRLYIEPTGKEWTVELNPEDVTDELLRGLREMGFGRVSLGVQSFHDDELSFLGRRHRAAKARWAIEATRRAGFEELSLDLMYGLSSRQSAARWCGSLDQALAFEPEHLSCYLLTLAEGTPLAEQSCRGQLELPGDEASADLFLLTSERLGEAGYEHYEVSNFAHGRGHRSRHNQRYWRHVPYLGLGPSAHSFDGARRWWNIASVEGYLDGLASGSLPTEGEEVLTEADLRLEALFLGLRTSDGVDLELVRTIPGWEAVLEALAEEGLARIVEGRVAPTVRGLLMSDGLPLRFDL